MIIIRLRTKTSECRSVCVCVCLYSLNHNGCQHSQAHARNLQLFPSGSHRGSVCVCVLGVSRRVLEVVAAAHAHHALLAQAEVHDSFRLSLSLLNSLTNSLSHTQPYHTIYVSGQLCTISMCVYVYVYITYTSLCLCYIHFPRPRKVSTRKKQLARLIEPSGRRTVCP